MHLSVRRHGTMTTNSNLSSIVTTATKLGKTIPTEFNSTNCYRHFEKGCENPPYCSSCATHGHRRSRCPHKNFSFCGTCFGPRHSIAEVCPGPSIEVNRCNINPILRSRAAPNFEDLETMICQSQNKADAEMARLSMDYEICGSH